MKKRGVKVFVGGVVVAVIAAVVWFVPQLGSDNSGSPKAEPAKRKEIAQATNFVTKAKPVDVKVSLQEQWKAKGYPRSPWGTPVPKDLEYKPHWLYTTNDYARVDPGYAERHQKFLERVAKKVWHTQVDNELSRLLFWQPGMPSSAMPFDKSFVDRLKKSNETPIIISKDDPPEVQEQKRQMIELKKELINRMADGEDIVETLNAEYRQLRKLQGMRQNLVNSLAEIERTATSVEEVQDFVDAANKMLSEAGATPIKRPLNLLRHKFELNDRRMQKESVK